MPSLGGSRRRHAKQTASSKKGAPLPPIDVSVSQSPDINTGSSTPKYSFASSSLRPSKRPALSAVRGQQRPSSGYKESRDMGLLEKENLNVFDFMRSGEESDGSEPTDEEPSQESPEPPSSKSTSPRLNDMPARSPRYSDLEVRAIQDGVQRTWCRASLHSDSGVSVRSHSPDQDSPILKDKSVFDHGIPMIEESGFENEEPESQPLPLSPDMNSLHLGFSHRGWPSEDNTHNGPEAFSPPLPIAGLGHHRPVSHDEEMPEMHSKSLNTLMQYRSRRSSVQRRPSKSGYDLLASNISAKDDALLKPIYRKFEILNNRMLLYLQDEIAQMEEDLRELDAAIAMEDHDLGRRGPASRRSEAKLPSQLQWHRLELLGRSFAKVEQYNRALSSYANLTKSMDSARGTDVSKYSRWIADHTPIAADEAGFLDHKEDLLAIPTSTAFSNADSQHEVAASSTIDPSYQKPTSSPSANTPSTSQLQQQPLETPIVVLSFALVSTTILFHVVPHLLARLVISLLTGVAALALLRPGALYSWDGFMACRSIVAAYVLVMGVLGFIVG